MAVPRAIVRTPLVLLASLLAAGTATADPAQLALGKRVFTEIAEPQCGACHTLADAGTTGEVGPVLDVLKPDAARVAAAVTGGIGVMPAFEDLTPEQVEAVALYVATAAGRAK
ncbi:cytochrome c [Methylobacterium sp. NEAU 140]|uniref:SorU family sulfite dehydrogenase c-type cytochrome subunit n=1 Tax=Methylobacterium sp. NEAU 140 TaxID=3064945 RepID=UPI002735555A|nr:cytochrome c [Methylobacterium sp. NEAU 140]MDP4022864.1 cytochrome c [Methylobacterium sp. NEAU 140]